MKYFFPSSSDFQVSPSFSGRQTRVTPCLICGTEGLWEIDCWGMWKREEVRGREHDHFIPWMRLESLYRPLYTTTPASADRHRWFCLEWRMWQGRISYSACDLLQTEKPALGLPLRWLWCKSLPPDFPFILSHMLLNGYQQHNIWSMKKYKKAKLLLPVPQTMWGIYSISQTSILLEFFFCCIFCFSTSLWQTQLKFQHINQTPPHPISTDLGTWLLLSQGLLELCALGLRKFPPSLKPQETDKVMVLEGNSEGLSEEEERALRAASF